MAEDSVAVGGRASRRRSKRRRSAVWRALRRAVLAVLIVAAVPFLLLPLYAVANPPLTAVQLLKALSGAGIDKSWVDIENISPHLVRAVIVSEDARFCEHKGIDWVEMQRALDDEDGRMRGASTITMQTVKNLFLWTGRSWIRKALEAPLALYAEVVLSKRRILEIYLNSVEWGTGLYGAAGAAEHSFNVNVADLSPVQAARLAAVLPAPTTRDAANPGRGTSRNAERIAARAERSGPYVDCVLG